MNTDKATKENGNLPIFSVMQSYAGEGIIHKPHTYKTEITREDIIKQKREERKETTKLIIDFIIAIMVFPAIAGFVGWLIPLQISVFIAIIIGFIDLIWFIGRRA